MRQYLVRLSAAWREAERSDHTAIFDQAYVQAIASILVAGGKCGEEDVMGLIALAPHADLAIEIEAPTTEVARRLQVRAQSIGRLGQFFELKLGGPAAYTRAVARLRRGLQRDGRRVINVSSEDTKTLIAEVERAYREIRSFREPEAAA